MRNGKSGRQERIVDALNHYPALRVSELAERFSVTTETIRRDLEELNGAGLLNRTYGGAIRATDAEPALSERHNILVAERERIARAAVVLVPVRGLLMIGSGATTVHVARRIAFERQNLTVITHSFGVATVLAANPTIRVIMCPGDYNPREGATYGAQACDFLGSFNADLAILGASGLAVEGASDALLDSALVYAAMVRRARQVSIVADRTKFDRTFSARFAEWSGVDSLVTDQQPTGALLSAISRAGTRIYGSSESAAQAMTEA